MKIKHCIDKNEKLKHCGDGEWIEEPDVVTFEHCGFRCLINRIWKRKLPDTTHFFGGHLCGYVEIPKTHPFFEKNCSFNLDIHGGITFSEGDEKTWLLGFFCCHLGDIIPTNEKFRNINDKLKELEVILPISEKLKNSPIFNPIYRNIDFVIEECKKLAEACKEVLSHQNQ